MELIKRLFDITVSLILIVFFLPLMIIVAVAIKMDSKGGVFFKQLRVGRDGKTFWVYKFRTLKNTSPKLHIETSKISSIDSFVFPPPPEEEKTKIGAFLRRSSINEIPQLFNVLKGDMSLVGPRPEIPEIVGLYDTPYKKRLSVKPGITGLAQIQGRGDLKLKEVIDFDLQYIEKQSFILDMKILFKTVAVVVSSEGAK